MSRKNRINRTLESALDDERREVMALLEGGPARSAGSLKAPASSAPRAGSRDHRNRLRAASPAGVAQSPVRSMLDLSTPAPPSSRPASLASPQSANFPRPAVRSMLDTDTPPATPGTHPPLVHARSAPGPSSTQSAPGSPEPTVEGQYRFDMPSLESQVRGHGDEQPQKRKGALSQVFSSNSEFGRPRHNSTSATLGEGRALSPSSRLGVSGRSMSPAQRGIDPNRVSSRTKYFSSTSGKTIDMTNAYRRLSDANLLRSGGNLANLASKRAIDVEKGESRAPDGGTRLEKDYFADDDNDAEDDDEAVEDSDDETEWQSERTRGRQRQRDGRGEQDELSPDPERTPKSLLAAAEQERIKIDQSRRYKSLIPDDVIITTPSGEKVSAKKAGIHPNTSFDDHVSRASTPINSDDEADISDIRRAQQMALNVSPIHSTPESHRCLRQIIRGDYDGLVAEAEKGLRRQRMYLVATDLSDEAAYALEWTIGTCLRDGDTLLAVYAVDEDQIGEGIGVAIGEGANMMMDTGRALKDITDEQTKKSDSATTPHVSSPLATGDGILDMEVPDLEKMDKAERERWHATIEVGDRCVKLLRKTRLQVRVVVEVFHCKSPKHMITEVVSFPARAPHLKHVLISLSTD